MIRRERRYSRDCRKTQGKTLIMRNGSGLRIVCPWHVAGRLHRNAILSHFLGLALSANTLVSMAQSPPGEAPSVTTEPVPAAAAQTATDDQAPLTDRERALLDRIRSLEERLSAVESKVSGAPAPTSEVAPAVAVVANTAQQTPQAPAAESQSKDQPNTYENWKNASSPETWGGLDPGNGFQVAKTRLGSLNISGYILLRYLNQLPAHQTFVDHLGNIQAVNPRNDIHAHRIILYFKGFIFNPRFTYMAFVWTVNATGQVAVVGMLNYRFNKYLSLSGGVNGFPGTRSLQGSHPYWLGHDRVMADEFFRPGFTNGVWATGEVLPRLHYVAMAGNNLSQLGLSAVKLTRDIGGGASFWWMPTTGEFGPRGAYGDYEWHEKLATRFGVSYAYSREDRFNEINNPSPDNVQIRLADSTLLFGTGTLAPGVTVQKADYYLLAEDAGFKYHGFFLMGEGYSRLLDRFQADGPLPMATIRDRGFFVQASQMVWPKRVEVYGATSYVYGDTKFGFGQSHEFLGGTNYYPVDSRNLRFNLQVIRVQRSPVSSVFGYYTAGQRGTIISLATSLLF